jgi:hypothetical protein
MPAMDSLRRKAGMREYTCGLCAEEFGSNCSPGDIQCTNDDCEARLCPCCGAWFTEDGEMSAAVAAAPQPAPKGKRVTLKLSETQPAPELARVLDDFTRTVINVSDRPALTAVARDVRKNHGMEAL